MHFLFAESKLDFDVLDISSVWKCVLVEVGDG